MSRYMAMIERSFHQSSLSDSSLHQRLPKFAHFSVDSRIVKNLAIVHLSKSKLSNKYIEMQVRYLHELTLVGTCVTVTGMWTIYWECNNQGPKTKQDEKVI